MERRKTSDEVRAAGRATVLCPQRSNQRIATARITRQSQRPNLFYDLEIDRVRLVTGRGVLLSHGWFQAGALPGHRRHRPKLAGARAAKAAIPEDGHR